MQNPSLRKGDDHDAYNHKMCALIGSTTVLYFLHSPFFAFCDRISYSVSAVSFAFSIFLPSGIKFLTALVVSISGLAG